VLLGAGLEEEFKWRKPCYTHGGSNVVIFQPFKELCALLFFKGVLLQDPDGALTEQDENTRSALRLEFRSVAEVATAKRIIAALVRDAIRIEQAGLSVPKRALADDGPYPEELDMLLDADSALLDAWERLSPRPPARLAAALQRRQAVQDPRGPHRARPAADLGGASECTTKSHNRCLSRR
jgi:uncharacterized protein YdeI (YjbR/CyaY-like superfamily)